MASEDPNPAPFDDEDDDLEDTDGDDTDIDDDEEAPPLPPPSTTVVDLAPDPTLPPQNGLFSAVEIVSDLKRPRIEERRPSALDESRRLFQRLWTDDDEIKILTGFLEFTSSRGTQFASHQYDTGPFYEQIKNQLQLDFNKNQLIEKLRRLKKKYRNTASRMANQGNNFTFKSPHEKETYEIANKIWPPSIKRSKESDEDDINPYSNRTVALQTGSRSRSRRRRSRKRSLDSLPVEIAAPAMLALPQPPPPPPTASTEGVFKVEVQTAPPAVVSPVVQSAGVVEETVKSCLSPIFKELLNSAVNAPFGLGLSLPPLLNFGGDLGSLSSDERWKKQQVLELEVYLKRVELIRDQVKSTLEELKASQSSGVRS